MGIPETSTRTSHAVAIRADGVTIGQIIQWQPNQARTVTATYEINPATTGEVYEQVPGNLTGLTITVQRYDLYSAKMEEVWGSNFSIQLLTDQTQGLNIQERWTNPDNTTEVTLYSGCWFTSLGRALSSQDDRIVRVNANLAYTRVRRML